MFHKPLPQLRQLSPKELTGTLQAAGDLFTEITQIVVFSIPLNTKFRGITRREGLLLYGPHGWGECSPFWDYDAKTSAQWLQSALSLATTPPPNMRRDQVPINVTIPACGDHEVRRRIELHPGCSTAKVKVADHQKSHAADLQRVHLTAKLLAQKYGEKGAVRIDANRAWNVTEATQTLHSLNRAAAPVGGLQYAEQPVNTVQQMAQLRRQINVPLAADESIRLTEDPMAVPRLNAADVAVLKVAPLGGIHQTLKLANSLRMPAVVSSALDTSIGLAAGAIMAAALPELNFACGLGTASILAADVIDKPLNPCSPEWKPTGAISVEAALQAKNAPLVERFENLSDTTFNHWMQRLANMCPFLLDSSHNEESPTSERTL